MLFPAFLSFLSLVRPLAAAMTLAQDSRHHHYYGSSLRSLEQQQNEQGNSTFPAVGDVVCIEGHVMVSVNVMHRRTSKQANKQTKRAKSNVLLLSGLFFSASNVSLSYVCPHRIFTASIEVPCWTNPPFERCRPEDRWNIRYIVLLMVRT